MDELACPACGRTAEPGYRFCPVCGAPLSGRAAAGAERKLVTAVVVDLVDYTGLSGSLDPEETRAVLEEYWRGVRAEIERYGGTVEKYIGDAVVGVFGAPAAHDDDAERAVRAALRIRDRSRAGAQPEVRVGVATGLALVRIDVRPEAGEALVVGDVVTTAARLQGQAPRSGVLVDEPTHAATARVVAYRQMSPVCVKGRREPLAAWRAVAAKRRVGAPPRTTFVGRRYELGLLTTLVERLHAGGGVELVTVVGEPGIGKSRLVAELPIGEADRWEMRTLPYGEGSAFSPLAELVKEQAGIADADDEAQASARLATLLDELLDDEAERRRVAPHVRRLIGLEAASQQADSSLESFAAWRRLFEAAAERRPLVLVLEDAHAADRSLLDFVEYLVEWAGPSPLLVICTARPDLLRLRPGWSGGTANSLTLSLTPLSDDETGVLVRDVLGPDADDDECAALLARAGGNPLYAEQLARMIGERAAPVAVPETLQAVIAARLDRLPPTAKEVLHDAAVVGLSFSPALLAALTPRCDTELEEDLHVLERTELVGRRHAGGDWSFRHPLVHEVAYAELPRAARAEKHLRVAEWLETRQRREDVAGAVAHHYVRAREESLACGRPHAELNERARPALIRAAERALDLSAFASAARLYAHALELWPATAPDRARHLLRYAHALWNAEVTGEAVALEARDALLAAGDLDGAAEAEALVSEMRWYRGDRASATAHLGHAVELVAGRPPSAAKTLVLCRLARARMLAAAYGEAIASGHDALALAEELGLVELEAEALNSIGSARVRSGDAAGVTDLERAIELAAGTRAAVVAYNNLSAVALESGDSARSREAAEQGRSLAGQLGDRLHVEWFEAEEVGRSFDADRWDDALDLADTWLASPPRTNYAAIGVLLVRAVILHARGDREAALENVGRAIGYARAAGDPQTLVPALATAAFVSVEESRPDEARAYVDEALALCERVGDLPPLGAFDLAVAACACGLEERLARVLKLAPTGGRWIEAARHYAAGELEESAARLDACPARWAASYVRLRLAEIDGAGLEDALAYYRDVGADAYVRRCEQLRGALALTS